MGHKLSYSTRAYELDLPYYAKAVICRETNDPEDNGKEIFYGTLQECRDRLKEIREEAIWDKEEFGYNVTRIERDEFQVKFAYGYTSYFII